MTKELMDKKKVVVTLKKKEPENQKDDKPNDLELDLDPESPEVIEHSPVSPLTVVNNSSDADNIILSLEQKINNLNTKINVMYIIGFIYTTGTYLHKYLKI